MVVLSSHFTLRICIFVFECIMTTDFVTSYDKVNLNKRAQKIRDGFMKLFLVGFVDSQR